MIYLTYKYNVIDIGYLTNGKHDFDFGVRITKFPTVHP